MRMKPNQWNPNISLKYKAYFQKVVKDFGSIIGSGGRVKWDVTRTTTRNNDSDNEKQREQSQKEQNWSKELHKYSQGRPVGAKWKKILHK